MTRPDRSRRGNLAIMAAAGLAPTTANITRGEGNLVGIKKADKLSLVGLPANQTGFKVLRGDKTEKAPTAQAAPTRIRRTRRSDTAQPVLALDFPAGTTREDVDKALASYGMADYTVQEEDGAFRAIRSDLQSISDDAIQVKLNDAGVVASVQRSESLAAVTAPAGEKSGVALVSLSFDAEKFTPEEVSAWLQRNDVDSTIDETQNSDTSIVVSRSEAPEGEEVRHLELESGVVATCVRADANDIPDGFYVVINETAYGSWGWGQLDFAASLADKAFSEQVRSGLSLLDDVLRNILFYSPLPLAVRKTLVAEAANQFVAFVSAMMDTLPSQLLATVVRSAPETQPSQQENDMTQKQAGGAPTTATTTQPAAGAAPAAAALTREDVTSIVTEVVGKSLAQTVEDVLKRSGIEVKPAEPDPATPLTRGDLTALLGDAVKGALAPIEERLVKMEGTTVVRNDNAPDPATTTTTKTPEQEAAQAAEDKKTGHVFRGAFPNMIRPAQRAA